MKPFHQYRSQVPYPVRPAVNAILDKTVHQLTSAEITTLPEIRRAHEADQKKYTEDLEAYRASEAEGLNDFQRDLEQGHGLAGNPKAWLLFAKAWELGSPKGFAETQRIYAELAELIV